MSDDKRFTLDELETVVSNALNKGRKIDNATHADDHAFIELMRKREERHVKRIEKFKQSFVGTIAVAVAGFVIWAGKLIIDTISHGQHPQP